MAAQGTFVRFYTVGVQPADAAGVYRVTYTPRTGSLGARVNGDAPSTLQATADWNDREVAVTWATGHEPGPSRDDYDRDVRERVRLFAEWITRLTGLVRAVEAWAKELGWSTRLIEKPMEDSRIGRFKAPALLMQEGVDRVLLEPIGRSAPGAEGVVDLYLMPAYDDIATLYYYEGRWNLHGASAKAGSAGAIRDAVGNPLSKDSLREALEELKAHAASR